MDSTNFFTDSPSSFPTLPAKELPGIRIDRIAEKILGCMAVTCLVVSAFSMAATIVFPSPLTITTLTVSLVALSILTLANNDFRLGSYLPEKLKLLGHYIHSLTTEVFAFIACSALYVFSAAKFDPKESVMTDKPPVLIVHGYLHNSSCAWYLKHRLKNAKKALGDTAQFGSVFSIDLGTPFHTIEEYAERVKSKLEEIKKLTGREDVVLIGHSMGGLVSLQYTQALAPEGTVKRVITIGSPLKGTHMAIFGIFGECAKQMKTNSPFIQRLKEGLSNMEGTRICHISSQTDLVVPSHSAVSNDSKEAKNHRLKNVGHLGLLYDDRVADLVIDFLQEDAGEV